MITFSRNLMTVSKERGPPPPLCASLDDDDRDVVEVERGASPSTCNWQAYNTTRASPLIFITSFKSGVKEEETRERERERKKTR